ncbi:MAG: ABC transporter substrate-binding protein [Anaerolineae bacterium]
MRKKTLGLTILVMLALTLGCAVTPAPAAKVVKETVVVEKVVTPAVPEVIKIRAWTIGPGPVPVTRATNLEAGASKLNELGLIPQKVVVEPLFSELKWGPFSEKFFTSCRAQAGPHIVTLKDIPQLATGGFIVPLDEHVEKYWNLGYDDMYASLWEAVTYTPQEGPYAGEEHIWGVPQDATPNGIWYRKDVLRELGYSDDDIAAMLPATAEGVTLDDVKKLAQEAREAGLVEWGILHRPSPGDTVYIYMKIFGGRVFDAQANQLVLTKSAALQVFQWFRGLVDEGTLSSTPPAWGVIHKAFVDGDALFTFASHVGTPSEWMAKYGLTVESFQNDLGFMLFPPAVSAAKPLGTLGPLAYLVTQGCVKPEDEQPEAAAAVLLMTVSPDLVVEHTVKTMRPPIRTAAASHPDLLGYEFAAYMRNAAAMLEFAEDVPKHPAWGKYKADVFEVLKGVEAGILTPGDGVSELEALLKADIPDIIIEE